MSDWEEAKERIEARLQERRARERQAKERMEQGLPLPPLSPMSDADRQKLQEAIGDLDDKRREAAHRTSE